MSTFGRMQDSAHDFIHGWSSPSAVGPDIMERLDQLGGYNKVRDDLEEILNYWWKEGYLAGNAAAVHAIQKANEE